MRQFETTKLIDGTGFLYRSGEGGFAALPTYGECEQMIRERAFAKWEGNGHTDFALDYWIAAENELFGGPHKTGGYRLLVCDLDDPKNQKQMRHWDEVLVTHTGIERL